MKEKKNVLILTADAGFGHRSAANAVEAALDEAYGDVCSVRIINPLEDKRAPFFLRESQFDYDRIVRKMPELYRLGFDASDATVPSAIAERTLTVLLYEVIHDIIQKNKPDVILNTFPLYQSAINAVFLISRQRVPMLTVITDLSTIHRLWFYEHVDGCLVPNNQVRDLALENDIPLDKIFITGIPVHPNLSRQKEPVQHIRESLGWDSDLTTILAVGSRRVDNLIETLNVINHFGRVVQLAVVAGKDKILYEELKQIEWHIPCHIYEYTSDMPHLMLASDVLICKAGGLIVTEALACGLPMILIDVIKGQETGNAEFVVNNHAGELASKPIEFLEVLSHCLLNDGKVLKERANKAHLVGKPYSAFHVADLVIQAANQGSKIKDSTSRRNFLMDLLTNNQIQLQDSIFPLKKKTK